MILSGRICGLKEIYSINKYSLKRDIEEIKNRLSNQDNNIELVFTYLDELIEKQQNPPPRKRIGYKIQSKAL